MLEYIVTIGRTRLYKVHRLVAEHFLPNFNSNLVVHHINSNKQCNEVYNLAQCTAFENLQHFRKFEQKYSYKCIQNSECFKKFKVFCKRHKLSFSKRAFQMAVREGIAYRGTEFHFKKVAI